MSRRGVLWSLAALVLLGGLLLTGWLARDNFLPVEVGSRAPDFAATDLAGNPVSLEQLRGQVVLLNVWATWCPPCRDEMPSMQRLHQRLHDRGLRVVAVSVDAASGGLGAGGQPGGDVSAFVTEMGLDFTIWRDPDGDVEGVYRTTGVPESFVIDRDGTIMKKVIGGTEWDTPANLELFERLLSR